MIPAALGRQANTPFSSPWIQSSSWTKFSCLDWRQEERYGVKESYRVRFSGSKVGRHFSMYSLNPEDGHISSRVLGSESKEGDEILLSESNAGIQPNGVDSFVDVSQEIGVIDFAKGSAFEGIALAEQVIFNSSSSAVVGGEVPVGEAANGSERDLAKSRKREYCKRCCKAASRCICKLIETQVNNQTRITILQHPLENNHHLGTARIAVVGLRNVELICVPEEEEQMSCRLRAKVPGSKREIDGRGGKKAQFLAAAQAAGKKVSIPRKRVGDPKRQTEATIQVKQEVDATHDLRTDTEDQVMKMATMGTKHVEMDVSSIDTPSWITLQSDVGLLFPSEHALDLRSVDLGDADSATSSARKPPSQLIVLDGTWSKAKRIFYENPWLHNLPHYRLPPSKGSSRYGIIRKEPKPGCMSTIESIVMALELLEPETEGLDKLLDVFEYMMEDQKVCMGERYSRLEEKVRLGRAQNS